MITKSLKYIFISKFSTKEVSEILVKHHKAAFLTSFLPRIPWCTKSCKTKAFASLPPTTGPRGHRAHSSPTPPGPQGRAGSEGRLSGASSLPTESRQVSSADSRCEHPSLPRPSRVILVTAVRREQAADTDSSKDGLFSRTNWRHLRTAARTTDLARKLRRRETRGWELPGKWEVWWRPRILFNKKPQSPISIQIHEINLTSKPAACDAPSRCSVGARRSGLGPFLASRHVPPSPRAWSPVSSMKPG